MDYKKKYKNALGMAEEIIRYYKEHNRGDEAAIEDLEEIFPELGKSEDERISKCVKYAIDKLFLKEKIVCDVRKDDVLAWLENQGEHKATDKVEPKFHEGDWIIDKQGIVHQIEKVIENVTNNTFAYDLVGGGYFNEEVKSCRLWTIDDAKDGDVLVDVYGNIGIFQKNDDFDWSSYCSLGSNGGFRCFAIEHELDGSHPATKEQRDTLFKAMTEAGYEWDDDKKESKLLISNGGDFESDDSEQKPTWSDEDENFMYDTLGNLTELKDRYGEGYGRVGKCIDWLKSLKERLS